MSDPALRLLHELKLSQVFDDDQLASVASEVAACQSLSEISRMVSGWITRKLISDFQAKLLLAGRAAELRVGNYILVSPLARGGMGEVFLARQIGQAQLPMAPQVTHSHVNHSPAHENTKQCKFVAIKFLAGSLSQDAKFLRRFERERELLQLLNHRGIVAVIDAGVNGQGVPFIVNEFVPGQSLHEHVATQGRLPWKEAIETIREMLDAIQHAHLAGVLHRDIKPANVMLGPDGRIKLLDFGLGRQLEQQLAGKLTLSGEMLGTVDYVSPEQALEGQATVQSDLYSLGCTLFFCLFGEPPYPRKSPVEVLRAHCFAPLPVLPFNFSGPRELQDILHRMLAKGPQDRFADCQAVRLALDKVLSLW